MKLDAIIEQLVPPFSVTFGAALLGFLASLATGRLWLIGLAAAALAALVSHLFLGLWSARAPAQVYRALLGAPRFMVWKLWVYALAFIPARRAWVKTERTVTSSDDVRDRSHP